MKLLTIWTMPAMATSERLRRTRDWAAMAVAIRPPTRITYWSFICQSAKATAKTEGHVMETTLDELLSKIDRPVNMS